MQTQSRYIVGNWKMNGDYALSMRMIGALRAMGPVAKVLPVVCPPFPLLHAFSELLGMGHAALGAQNCSHHPSGAHTGEVSAAMLKEQGCKYVIVGHSERRSKHFESDDIVSLKANMACETGLVPIICVGESKFARDHGTGETLVAREVQGVLAHSKLPPLKGEFIIAYEPVWAIGTGEVPAADDIARMHSVIARTAAELGHRDVTILYGGSVKPDNAAGILAVPGVGGVLLGGAAIDPEQFIAIAKLAGSLP